MKVRKIYRILQYQIIYKSKSLNVSLIKYDLTLYQKNVILHPLLGKIFSYFLKHVFFDYTKIPLRVINHYYSLSTQNYVYIYNMFLDFQECNCYYIFKCLYSLSKKF